MNRREFLYGAAKSGIIIAGAPAIVRAESLMKIWVPPEVEILTDDIPFREWSLASHHLNATFFVGQDMVRVRTPYSGDDPRNVYLQHSAERLSAVINTRVFKQAVHDEMVELATFGSFTRQ